MRVRVSGHVSGRTRRPVCWMNDLIVFSALTRASFIILLLARDPIISVWVACQRTCPRLPSGCCINPPFFYLSYYALIKAALSVCLQVLSILAFSRILMRLFTYVIRHSASVIVVPWERGTAAGIPRSDLLFENCPFEFARGGVPTILRYGVTKRHA